MQAILTLLYTHVLKPFKLITNSLPLFSHIIFITIYVKFQRYLYLKPATDSFGEKKREFIISWRTVQCKKFNNA